MARVVLTGFEPRTSVAAHVEQEIENARLPEIKVRLHDLVAFEEMTFNGLSPRSARLDYRLRPYSLRPCRW